MKNLNTHIKIVLAVIAMIGLANFANAQNKKPTKVIDNKGNIKYVLDSTTKFVSYAQNGVRLLNDSTVVLGGNLTEATTITANGNHLTFDVSGDSLFIKGLGKGLSSDSLLVQSANGAIRKISADSLLTNIQATNGLTKHLDSVKLGGALTEATTISATPTNSLTLQSGGTGSINFTGLTSGNVNDSIATIDPATHALRYISKSTLLSGLTAKNGLHKDADSIKMGGDLTENTTINTNGKGLIVNVGATDSLAINGVQSGNLATDSLLVRNATTGKVGQVSVSVLTQSGEAVYTSGANHTSNFNLTSLGSATSGSLAGLASDATRVWVYRNGAKLVKGVDYVISSGDITLQPQTGINAWSDQTGDIYEVQWIK